MTQPQLDENKLLELLELARTAEQKMRKSSEGLTALAEKWQNRAETRCKKAQKQ
jgi:hypothetical protein